jgi:exosortase A-associated hydrolase 2
LSLLEPFFLPHEAGRLYCVYHRPEPHAALRGNILCVPPFNEEMNRCRSMITLQAQAFAEAGFGTLVIDLPGTGDSYGDHGDATWEAWQSAVLAGHHWLGERGGCAALWGLRLGVALGLSAFRGRPDAPRRLIAWLPVVDGKTHLTQFLRVRIAAQLDNVTAPKETTSSMRQQFAQGQSVEVAGYEINPRLAASLDALRPEDVSPPPATQVLWLEQQREADGPNAAPESTLSPAGQRVVDRWISQGVEVSARLFSGPAFWQRYERAVAPEIIAHSREWMLDASRGDGA